MKSSFHNYTLSDLRKLLIDQGLAPVGADRLFNWHYKQKKNSPCQKDLAKSTIEYIEQSLSFDLPEIDTVQESSDRTVKFLFKLRDGKKVETVLIPSVKKYGICLSSQV